MEMSSPEAALPDTSADADLQPTAARDASPE